MTTEDKLKLLVELPPAEKRKFATTIRKLRATHIPSPSKLVDNAIATHREVLDELTKFQKVSEAIRALREAAYQALLQSEAPFNALVVTYIGQKIDAPRETLQRIVEERLPKTDSRPELEQSILPICGEYTAQIMPYLYQLCQSNTQSRRSRAGETFEQLVYALYRVYGYPFDSQKKIGRKLFRDKGLGKKVDSVLPSIKAFEDRRDKVVVGTMKTTLRERWQEVVEELDRTKVPKIYLLTVDEDIALSKAQEMGNHNIVLVVYESVKRQAALAGLKNIISFETYFHDELANELSYWKDKAF